MKRYKYQNLSHLLKLFFLLILCIEVCTNHAYSQNKNGKLETHDLIKERPRIQIIPGMRTTLSTAPVSYDIIKDLDLSTAAPYLEIKDILFSNFDSLGTIINDYGEKLYASETKYIGSKVSYRGLQNETKEIFLKIKISTSDGKLIAEKNAPEGFSFVTNATINPGYNTMYINGLGNNIIKVYEAGTYDYEIWQGNQKIYSKSLEIVTGKSPLYESKIFRIDKIQFINMDREGNLLSSQESEDLDARKMRFLHEIIKYEGFVNSKQEIPVQIRLFFPNGNLSIDKNSPKKYSYKAKIPIENGINNVKLGLGWGNDKISIYEKGIYIFEIWESNKKIYETTFRMK